RVYHNNRDGTFREQSRELGIDGCWGTMSGAVADVNNDGFLDFLLGNGGPRVDRLEPLVLLENDGRRFHDVTFTAGLPAVGKNHAGGRIGDSLAWWRFTAPGRSAGESNHPRR